jgi:hypothetical protein
MGAHYDPARVCPSGSATPHLAWHPIELGDLFRLTKNRREARAALFTHQLGWEVRLLVGSQLEFVQTQVCRDQEEVLRTGGGVEGGDDREGLAITRADRTIGPSPEPRRASGR